MAATTMSDLFTLISANNQWGLTAWSEDLSRLAEATLLSSPPKAIQCNTSYPGKVIATATNGGMQLWDVATQEGRQLCDTVPMLRLEQVPDLPPRPLQVRTAFEDHLVWSERGGTGVEEALTSSSLAQAQSEYRRLLALQTGRREPTKGPIDDQVNAWGVGSPQLALPQRSCDLGLAWRNSLVYSSTSSLVAIDSNSDGEPWSRSYGMQVTDVAEALSGRHGAPKSFHISLPDHHQRVTVLEAPIESTLLVCGCVGGALSIWGHAADS
mmetsp:Transcript_49723/g.116890  ORF Transcript_49723/g.116890 Transcript_49723/m.116890 type:complete len:268 (+) Transcript_49723:19-822(+)